MQIFKEYQFHIISYLTLVQKKWLIMDQNWWFYDLEKQINSTQIAFKIINSDLHSGLASYLV